MHLHQNLNILFYHLCLSLFHGLFYRLKSSQHEFFQFQMNLNTFDNRLQRLFYNLLGLYYILLYAEIQIYQHLLFKMLCFPYFIFLMPFRGLVDYVCGLISGFFFCSVSMCLVCLVVSCCFSHYSYGVWFEIRKCDAASSVFS